MKRLSGQKTAPSTKTVLSICVFSESGKIFCQNICHFCTGTCLLRIVIAGFFQSNISQHAPVICPLDGFECPGRYTGCILEAQRLAGGGLAGIIVHDCHSLLMGDIVIGAKFLGRIAGYIALLICPENCLIIPCALADILE